MRLSILKLSVIAALLATPVAVYSQTSNTASILPPAKTTFLDKNGKPLAAGTVDFYIPGTTTRKMTWQDAGQTVPNTNPVVLDTSGRGIILGDGSYRQVVKDKNGNVIWDQVTSSAGSGGGGGGTPTVGDGDVVGTIKAYAGFIAPYGYTFAYGQELVRGSYPEAFAAITSQQNVSCTIGNPTLTGVTSTSQLPIGSPIESSCLNSGATIVSKTSSTVTASSNAIISTTTTARFFPFGNGNGLNTFNLPDLRGRIIAGNDIMGGIAANRLTSTYFGTNAGAIGANGGNQSQTIVTNNLPPYTPSGTITNGAITSTMPAGYQVIVPSGGTQFATGTQTGININAPVINNSQATSTFTGASQGGTSAPIAIIQPTQTQNYIIKIIPDSNPNSFFGVASIGGMYGVITCGYGITCAGNEISAVASVLPPPTPTILGGVFSSNAPPNEFAIGVDTAGNILYGGGSTTVNGQICTIGSSCTITASAGTITVGTTTVASGSTNGVLYNNGGMLGSITTANNALLSTNGSGVPSWATGNIVTNTLLAQVGAATIKGNPTAGTANVQDFTIQGLTNLVSPNATLDYIPIYDHLTGTIKNATPAAIGSVAGVASFNSRTGAVIPQIGDYTASIVNYTASGSSAVTRTTQSRLNDIINVNDYGADPTGSSNSQPAFQAAVNYAISLQTGNRQPCVYIPPTGGYRIDSTVLWNAGVPCITGGSGGLGSRVFTTNNIPIFTIDTSAGRMDGAIFSNINCVDEYTSGAQHTGVSCLLITGTDSFNYSRVHDLFCNGTYYCVLMTVADPTPSGGEIGTDWNTYFNFTATNFGPNNVQFAFRAELGSGTGNTWHSFNTATASAAISIGNGNSTYNVGDIVIWGIHAGGSNDGIQLFGDCSGTVYRSTISISSSQFDGGVVNGVNLSCMGNIYMKNIDWGGAARALLPNSFNYNKDGAGGGDPQIGVVGRIGYTYHQARQSDASASVVDSTVYAQRETWENAHQSVAASSTVPMFEIVMNGSVFKGCYVTITSTGLIQGLGAGLVTTKYHILKNNTTPVVTVISNDNNSIGGPTTLSHTVTIGGNSVVINAVNGGSANSNIASVIEVDGNQDYIKLR